MIFIKRLLTAFVAASMLLSMPILNAMAFETTIQPSFVTENKTYTPQNDGTFVYVTDGDSILIMGVLDNNITNAVIPEKIENKNVIGLYKGIDPTGSTIYNTFANNKNLKSVVIPDTVQYIEKGMFENCASLKHVSLPENLEYIQDDLFKNCASLESVYIPCAIKYISKSAFTNCPNFKTIYTMSSSSVIAEYTWNNKEHPNLKVINSDPSSIVQDDDTKIDNEYKLYKTNTSPQFAYIIKDGTITIVGVDDSDYNNVVIPDKINNIKVTKINRAQGGKTELHLFENNKNLKSVVIPDSIEEIGPSAFSNCTSLENVKMSANIKSICSEAFKNCTSLKSITLPSTIGFVSSSAFENCNIEITYSSAKGDIDNDGAISSADALLVLRYSVGLEKFTEEQINNSDVDHDGTISSADALKILRASVGLEKL